MNNLSNNKINGILRVSCTFDDKLFIQSQCRKNVPDRHYQITLKL